MTPRTSNERGATPDIDHDGQSGSPAKRRRTKSPTTGPTSEDSSSSPASAVERTFKPVFPVKAKSVWTPEKQAILLDDIIKAGTKAADLDALAERLGVTKNSVMDQLKANRNNVRATAISAVRNAKANKKNSPS